MTESRDSMNRDLEQKLAAKDQSYRIFNSIYRRYDFLNRLFSMGLDVYWRYKMAAAIKDKQNPNLLDLATGTGDVAFSLLRNHKTITHACGLDMSHNMLQLARQKAIKKKLNHRAAFLEADAANIPVDDQSFDVATMSFGIRNVPQPPEVMKEIKRILKPNGKALILEFSLPTNRLIKTLHLFYLRHIIPKIGALISKDKLAYAYLNKTIETFPYGDNFCQWMREAGFQNVTFTPLTMGIVTLYQGEKTSDA